MEWSSSSSSSDSSRPSDHHHHPHPHELFFDEGLLIEILIRVPTSREANRLKLVCRHWNSLISSPYFITCFDHRRHDPSLLPFPHRDSSSYSLAYNLRKEIRLFRYRYTGRSTAEFDATHVLDLGFLPIPQGERTVVHCSCADLIVCSYEIYRKIYSRKATSYFFVCNLLTKQWVALPPASVDVYPSPGGEAVGLLSVPPPCSLCPHSASRDDNSLHKFTVVRIPKCNLPYGSHARRPVSEFNIELYSSEEGRWRSCVVKTPKIINSVGKAFMGLVAYRGMLHWLIDGHILVYDPYNSPTIFSRIIDVPPPHSSPYTFSSFGVRQDRLHLTTVSHTDFNGTEARRDRHLKDHYIWELEDYDTGKWSLVHKLHPGNWYSCEPEDLVYVTGRADNPQPSQEDTWFSNFREESFRYYRWFGGCSVRPKIAANWGWPTPILSPPVIKRP